VYLGLGFTRCLARNWHRKHSPLVCRTLQRYLNSGLGCSSTCGGSSKHQRKLNVLLMVQYP
jgi:hypothetical protein